MTDQTMFTEDTFYKGRVLVKQPRKGYRFSVDAPILADFLPETPNGEALEIGSGCGVISLLALYMEKFRKIHGLEIQERLYNLAADNTLNNGYDGRFLPVHGDFNELCAQYSDMSVVFANPPYYPLKTGRLSPDPEIRDAKFETKLTLLQLLEKSRGVLAPTGCLCLILPSERRNDLEQALKETGYATARRREIFSFKDGKAERFLVQLSLCPVTPETPEPLVIFRETGVYTDEMNRILTGQPNA